MFVIVLFSYVVFGLVSSVLSQEIGCEEQGCSLGLDVSVLRQSRDVVSKRLGLVSVSSRSRGNVGRSRSRSRLGLKTNVSVSSRSHTIGSRLQANMHSSLLHCKIACRPTLF